jgi:hypothetical protein
MHQRKPDGSSQKRPTRYVLVKWKGYELDCGDAGRNGGWERYEALAQGGSKKAAQEAWAEFSRGGGKEQVEAASEALRGGELSEQELRWLQAPGSRGGGGKKGKKKQ